MIDSIKDAQLIEYILGSLNANENNTVEKLLQHQETSERIQYLRQSLAVFDEVKPIKTSSRLKNNLLNSIRKSKQNYLSGFSERLSAFFKLSKQRIDEILIQASDLSLPHWDKDMIPGANLLHFDGGTGLESADCGLIHLKPGNGVGDHQHNGDEWMFILQGNISSSDDSHYQAGDIVYRQKGTKHSVVATGKQDCIFAVIADQGVTFF